MLLALLSICCVAEIVTRALIPRDLATALNLLSKDRADYSPWLVPPGLAAIPPELAAAEAAERATATSVALRSTPTLPVVGSVPTIQVPVVPPALDAPTPTPGDVLIVEPPTVTPRPVGSLPTNTPVIATIEPVTNTPTQPPLAQPTATNTASPVSQPTNTAQLPTATGIPQPTDTLLPASPTVRLSPVPTRTPAPVPTDTPIPTPTEEPTPVPTETPTPVPTATFTPAPPDPVPPTPVPPTPTFTSLPMPTPTFTPLPTPTPTFTPSPTPTFTPSPSPSPTETLTPTPTETPTPTPTETLTPTPVPDVRVTKSAAPNPVQVRQMITWTIEILNTGTTDVTVTRIYDTFEYGGPIAFTIGPCSSPQGGSCTVGGFNTNATWNGTVTLAPGQSMQLLISGIFFPTLPPPGDARCNIRWEVDVTGIGTISSGSPALCVDVLP
ncbi:MAG: hypothetical protein J7463_08965 [Roseiflexus sp.]|nr:hypothetical protein [Roseiflexus sp.]